jgi:type I restriction enzyme S subunit
MAADKRKPVTIESLLKSGAILGHKDGNYGSQYPRIGEFGVEGVPFLTAKSLSDGRIDIDGAPRLSEQRANDLRFGFVQSGDVLLAHNATVGRVAVVPNFKGKLLIGTSLTYFRVDPTRILPREPLIKLPTRIDCV